MTQEPIDKQLKYLLQNIQNNIHLQLSNEIPKHISESLPNVTGSVRADFAPMGNSRFKKQTTVGKFATKGEAAILLEERDRLGEFGYPRFVSFVDEPSLEDWVMSAPMNTRTRQEFLDSGKVPIGFKNTSFGSSRNKWFTKTNTKIIEGMNNTVLNSIQKSIQDKK